MTLQTVRVKGVLLVWLFAVNHVVPCLETEILSWKEPLQSAPWPYRRERQNIETKAPFQGRRSKSVAQPELEHVFDVFCYPLCSTTQFHFTCSYSNNESIHQKCHLFDLLACSELYTTLPCVYSLVMLFFFSIPGVHSMMTAGEASIFWPLNQLVLCFLLSK